MLDLASAVSPSAFDTRTSASNSAAVWTNTDAGRACRPFSCSTVVTPLAVVMALVTRVMTAHQ